MVPAPDHLESEVRNAVVQLARFTSRFGPDSGGIALVETRPIRAIAQRIGELYSVLAARAGYHACRGRWLINLSLGGGG